MKKKVKINIDYVAKLSLMHPSDSLKAKLEGQLEKTLEHVEELEEVNTDHITGTNEVTSLSNVTREDTTTPSLSQEEALSNAKNTHNGFFVVDAVLPGE